jgi:hypothetical protein
MVVQQKKMIICDGFSFLTQDGLKLIIFPQPPQCWDYRHAPPAGHKLTLLTDVNQCMFITLSDKIEVHVYTSYI